MPFLRQAEEPRRFTGMLGDAAYSIELPSNWNGTLLLFSHGTIRPGSPNPAVNSADALSGAWLLEHGYALAGSSFSTTGYAIAESTRDNIALLDHFIDTVGQPERTIAWGNSQGGMSTAAMVQRTPERFDGALVMSGFLAGAVAQENIHLDSMFVIKTLLAADAELAIVDIPDGQAAVALAQQIITGAQATSAGRARLALAAAVGDVPGWFEAGRPAPARNDFRGQQAHQYRWFRETNLEFYLFHRWEIEQRAGGNFSWNRGVEYERQLERSTCRDEVKALYARAGLRLADDLAVLARAPRIEADQAALTYLIDNIVFDGNLQIPVLSIHTVGDGRRVVQQQAAYADIVRSAGRLEMLRQGFVNRGGHCTWTPAEKIAALLTVERRLKTGRWQGEDAASLNALAVSLGPTLNVQHASAFGPALPAMAPGFIDLQPTPFLRPWDARCLAGGAVVPAADDGQPICL
jgi:pimeloyl-ACP methyl ester carboxylesterase